MADLLPLWQTLAGGGVTLIATVVTQGAIGRRDRNARAQARTDELADLADEREHARKLEVRARSREAAERTLALAVGLRDAASSATGDDDPFLSSQGSGMNGLTTAALLVEDSVVRHALETSRSTIVIWSISVLIDGVSRTEARTQQTRVIRSVVSLLSAYLRGDDAELQVALAGISAANEQVYAERAARKEERTGGESKLPEAQEPPAEATA